MPLFLFGSNYLLNLSNLYFMISYEYFLMPVFAYYLNWICLGCCCARFLWLSSRLCVWKTQQVVLMLAKYGILFLCFHCSQVKTCVWKTQQGKILLAKLRNYISLFSLFVSLIMCLEKSTGKNSASQIAGLYFTLLTSSYYFNNKK